MNAILNGIIEKLYTEYCYFTPQQGEPLRNPASIPTGLYFIQQV